MRSSLLAASLIALMLVAPIKGAGASRRLVYLDANDSGDVFTYDPITGAWSREVSDSAGGFTQQSQGSWAPGWTVLRADFNTDVLTDFFLFNRTTGAWAKMLNDGIGFTTQSTGAWAVPWDRYAMELDGDGITDIFVHNPATGIWFKCISTPTGFTYINGGWNTRWETYVTNFNGDGLDDLFLINRTTGRWFWALGENGPGFTYPVTETWFPWWAIYPGDFNGDGLTDILGHDPVTGVHFTGLTNASGFTFQQSVWSLGWTPSVMRLNDDGRDDLFLHAPATGTGVQMMSDGAGQFSNAGGQTWSLGWRLRPTDLNDDGRDDLVLYDPATGGWYQARNLIDGTFTYSNGTWSPGLDVVTQRSVRPECAAFVNFGNTSFPAAGGLIEGQVVTTTPDCSWSLSATGSWLTMFPSAGTGPARVTAIATTTSTAMSATIGIGSQQLVMSKAGETDLDQLGIIDIFCFQVVPNHAPPFYECMVVPRQGRHPYTTGIRVIADLSPIGRSANQALYYAQDGAWVVDLGVPEDFPKGLVMLSFRVTDDQGRVATGRAPLVVK